jgi:exopolyphosphatase/guanosine-5'-triphosphate,3'-diphosphate pyrophosphatase
VTALAAGPQPSAKLQPTVRKLICGCIDIGTNTTRLLVAEIEDGRLGKLRSERVFTPLGPAAEGEGGIAAAKVAEIAEVAGRFADTARAAGCDRVAVLATAAVRAAPNADAVATAVAAASGLDLVVLSGEQEARLMFAGATHGTEHGRDSVAVVDVGGGSTELAVGVAGEPADWWCSLPIGSGIATEECVRSDPPGADELDRLRDRVDAALADLDPPPALHALAIGGTALSLLRVVGTAVEPAAFERTLEVLAALPCAAAGERFSIHPDRVRLLPAGLLILGGIAARLGLELTIAGGGLREGVVLALAEDRL